MLSAEHQKILQTNVLFADFTMRDLCINMDTSQANACIENLIKQNNEKRMIVNKVNSRRVLIQKSSNDITALANPAIILFLVVYF
jgi:hypothetical protein